MKDGRKFWKYYNDVALGDSFYIFNINLIIEWLEYIENLS